MKRSVRMHEKDQVSTVLNDVKCGDIVGIYNEQNEFLYEIEAKEDIPIKYGEKIGELTKGISKGELVHVHNVKSLSVEIPPAFKKEIIRQMNIKLK